MSIISTDLRFLSSILSSQTTIHAGSRDAGCVYLLPIATQLESCVVR